MKWSNKVRSGGGVEKKLNLSVVIKKEKKGKIGNWEEKKANVGSLIVTASHKTHTNTKLRPHLTIQFNVLGSAYKASEDTQENTSGLVRIV
ncbi:hypothetical protein ACTXT7_010965 [Hymenolepis weldensis]